MSRDQYLGNPNLKKGHTKSRFSKERIEEVLKCLDDPKYLENTQRIWVNDLKKILEALSNLSDKKLSPDELSEAVRPAISSLLIQKISNVNEPLGIVTFNPEFEQMLITMSKKSSSEGLLIDPSLAKEMIKSMKRGSVIVDVAIDQGGCVETSKPTTHGNPTFIVDDVVHYCVANMPGGVPRTSTFALNTATLPYLVKLANKGYQKALGEDKNFLAGLNVFKGQVTYKAVADVFGHEYVDPTKII